MKGMTSHFDKLDELPDEMRATKQRLASLEQGARQPRLAMGQTCHQTPRLTSVYKILMRTRDGPRPASRRLAECLDMRMRRVILVLVLYRMGRVGRGDAARLFFLLFFSPVQQTTSGIGHRVKHFFLGWQPMR